MVAGINGASNSPANKKKTKDYDSKTGEMKTAWMPAPPSKPKKEILSKMQWHNKRLKILTEEERDIGPYPGKNQ